MPSFRPRIRAVAVGVGAFALVAVAAGGTVAASNPATLYACYDNYGNVRMGDTAQCKLPGGGRLVTWSTAGIPGPTGPTGPQGPTGPTGPAGPSGVRAWARVDSSGAIVMGSHVVAVNRFLPGFYSVGLDLPQTPSAAIVTPNTAGARHGAAALPGCVFPPQGFDVGDPCVQVAIWDEGLPGLPSVDSSFTILIP